MNSTSISLGWDCGPAIQGVERGLRQTKEQGYKTCPFDLMITNYQGIINCIQEDFKYFCEPQYLHVLTIDNDYTYLSLKKGDRVIVNTKYNFIFNHESPGHGNLYIQENWENGQEHFIIDNFKSLIERYTRRIQNFRNYIYDPNMYIHFIISKPFKDYTYNNQALEKIINQVYKHNRWQLVPIDDTREGIYKEAQELMLSTIPSFFQQINPQPPEQKYKVAFIIAHKYIRGHPTNIDYYVSNIQMYYKNSSIFIVDNQSQHLEDIQSKFVNQPNVHFLINDSDSKFELGAYNYGIKHLISTNQINNYDYYVFTQDSFILKNKYDFNILRNNRIRACPIMEMENEAVINSYHVPFVMKILMDIGVSTELHNLTLCLGNSFVLHQSKIEDFYSTTQNILITTKEESNDTERFLAGILYKLNGKRNFNIDGFIKSDLEMTDELPYNPWIVNVKYYKTDKYFIKRIYNKTQDTQPIE